MIAPSVVCAAVRKVINTPYQHQARQLGRGVDCIGVVVLVGRALGCCGPLFDIIGYSREPHDGMLLNLLDGHLQQLKGPTAGAIAAIRWVSEPQHVGIIVNPLNLVHAYAEVGKCVEHTFDKKFQKRTVRYYAFPGVEYPADLLLAPVKADLSRPVRLNRG